MHPNFRLCIPLLEVTDYKYLDGYGKQKKLRATRGERIPEALLGEVICESRWDYLNLLPEDLPEPFTTKTLAKAMRRAQTQAQCAANVLYSMGVLERVGKEKNAYLYVKNRKNKSISLAAFEARSDTLFGGGCFSEGGVFAALGVVLRTRKSRRKLDERLLAMVTGSLGV